MAAEPITIYSFRIDPLGVLTVLRTLEPSLQVIGPEDNWEKIIIIGSKRFWKKAPVLTITHDEDFYNGSGWSNHVLGLQGYLSQFPATNRTPGILQKVGDLGFIIATIAEPEIDLDSSDEGSKFILAIANHLNGVIFSPSTLRDARGRVLMAREGNSDPEAVVPEYPNREAIEIPTATEAEEELKPEPPTQERVARRALALAAVSARGLFEKEGSRPEYETDRKKILSWIDAIKIGEELEPDEWKVLQRPIGSLDRQGYIDATWRIEGLSVLSWALQRAELPPYDQQVDSGDLFAALGYWNADAGRSFLASAKLRTIENWVRFRPTCLQSTGDCDNSLSTGRL